MQALHIKRTPVYAASKQALMQREGAAELGKKCYFAKQLARVMREHLNGMIANEKVVAELIKMAEEMATARSKGDAMVLNEEELAFYNVLTRPEAVKDFYPNEKLVAMTHELTEQLRQISPLTGREKNQPEPVYSAW